MKYLLALVLLVGCSPDYKVFPSKKWSCVRVGSSHTALAYCDTEKECRDVCNKARRGEDK